MGRATLIGYTTGMVSESETKLHVIEAFGRWLVVDQKRVVCECARHDDARKICEALSGCKLGTGTANTSIHKPLASIRFSEHLRDQLEQRNIKTSAQLAEFGASGLKSLKYVGDEKIQQVRKWLDECGLELSD